MPRRPHGSGMDDDALREATERWVDAELIDPDTAIAIREFERDRPDGERDRLVVALSLMGAVLIGAGVLTYLWSNWSSLSVATRTTVLVAAPLAAGGAGLRLARGRYPKVGHGCWFLGAAFLGASLFMLADLYGIDVGADALLLAWAAVALPAGHAFESRPTTALGLAAALGAAVAAAPDELLLYVAAFAGTVVVAAGLGVRPRSDRLAGVYRIVGLVPVVAMLVIVALQEGEYGLDGPVADPVLVVAALGAVVAVGWVLLGWRRGEYRDADALAVTAPGAAAAAGLVVVLATPPLPALVSFLVAHAILLGLLVAVVRVAVDSHSRALVNLVAVAFLIQVVSFLFSTLADVLERTLTLIVAGLVLLAVGFALERARRRLLAEMEAG